MQWKHRSLYGVSLIRIRQRRARLSGKGWTVQHSEAFLVRWLLWRSRGVSNFSTTIELLVADMAARPDLERYLVPYSVDACGRTDWELRSLWKCALS